MISVVFVCLGNICRSPMAEAVFRDLAEKEGLSEKIAVSSCGTSGFHTGEPPHKKTIETLGKYNISHSGIYSKLLNKRHFDANYIIAMDKENLSDILAKKPGSSQAEIGLLSKYSKGSKSGWVSVPDPWYTGDFEQTYRLIEEGAKGLLAEIRRAHSL